MTLAQTIISASLIGRNLDCQLALGCAPARAQVLDELYRRHNRRVYWLCLRMTGNVSDAEDLSQEVFIHLMSKIESFRGESAFTTWLHRLTTNHVLMHFRKRNCRLGKITTYGDVPELITAGSQHPGRMSIIDHITLDNAIRQLPPGKRAVFVLYDVEGYGHEEIAGKLGCSIGTSKSQLHKARMRLRTILRAST